jgi:hypothetical protein
MRAATTEMLRQLGIEQNGEILSSAPRLGDSNRAAACAAVPGVFWDGWCASRNLTNVATATVFREVVGDVFIYKQLLAHEVALRFKTTLKLITNTLQANLRNAFNTTHQWNTATQASAQAAIAAVQEARYTNSKAAIEKAVEKSQKKLDAVTSKLQACEKHQTALQKHQSVAFHERALANGLKQAEEDMTSAESHLKIITDLLADACNFGAEQTAQQEVLTDLNARLQIPSLRLRFPQVQEVLRRIQQLAVPVNDLSADAASAAGTPQHRPAAHPSPPPQLQLNAGGGGGGAAFVPLPAASVSLPPAAAVPWANLELPPSIRRLLFGDDLVGDE